VRRVALCAAFVACTVAGGALAASSLRVSLQTQGHTVPPGGAWAYYLRVSQGNRPWRGTVDISVRRPTGKLVDDVGRFAIDGTLLRSYVWNSADKGTYDFTVTVTQGGKTLRTITYPVLVRHG